MPIYLGVIETWTEHYDQEVSTTPYIVRAVFQYKDHTWRALPDSLNASSMKEVNTTIEAYPKDTLWTIAFDGRNRGQLRTERPAKWDYYSDVGWLQPLPGQKVELITVLEGNYWISGPDNKANFRPMIVVSHPNYSDPDHWKPSPVPPQLLQQLIPEFRVQVSSALSCDGMEMNYPDELIQSLKSYQSADGTRLVQLGLDDSGIRKCDFGPGDYDDYESRWFYVKGNTVRYIGNSLDLIDAGDYDNDGHSEVVFHQSGYNFDGYLLLYDGLQKQAQFGWNYH